MRSTALRGPEDGGRCELERMVGPSLAQRTGSVWIGTEGMEMEERPGLEADSHGLF